MRQADALVVIDLQQRYTLPGAPFELPRAAELIAATNDFAERCRSREVPVIWLHRLVRPQVGPGRRTSRRYGAKARDTFSGHNGELDARLDVNEKDIVIGKPRQSGFFGSDLDSVLRNLQRERLLLAGVTTNVCVLATAQDAAARDYEVVVVDELTASMPVRREGEELLSAEEVQRASLAFVWHAIGEVRGCAELDAEG